MSKKEKQLSDAFKKQEEFLSIFDKKDVKLRNKDMLGLITRQKNLEKLGKKFTNNVIESSVEQLIQSFLLEGIDNREGKETLLKEFTQRKIDIIQSLMYQYYTYVQEASYDINAPSAFTESLSSFGLQTKMYIINKFPAITEEMATINSQNAKDSAEWKKAHNDLAKNLYGEYVTQFANLVIGKKAIITNIKEKIGTYTINQNAYIFIKGMIVFYNAFNQLTLIYSQILDKIEVIFSGIAKKLGVLLNNAVKFCIGNKALNIVKITLAYLSIFFLQDIIGILLISNFIINLVNNLVEPFIVGLVYNFIQKENDKIGKLELEKQELIELYEACRYQNLQELQSDSSKAHDFLRTFMEITCHIAAEYRIPSLLLIVTILNHCKAFVDAGEIFLKNQSLSFGITIGQKVSGFLGLIQSQPSHLGSMGTPGA